ncbi:MAG: transport system ATP-binding/permease protein, partial [Campylobacterota bacterium]|nr:transport system ATP-binding/permease protein [Campylobacterota bacterium]
MLQFLLKKALQLALVDLKGIYKNFEAQKILENIDFHIEEGERVAIVGKNGSGKSTLMKIVSGALDFDDGRRATEQNRKIEMLAQVPKFKQGIKVKDAIEQALKELYEAKQKHSKLSLQIAQNHDDKTLLDELTKISTFLDFHNAWNLDDKIERIMQVFDLKEHENQEVAILSGGEQRRVALAGLLLKKPDLLLLDEPTNHLDVYMVKFLEEILLAEKFTILCISHDRYFIERIATRTVEIEDGSLRSFRGGYLSYLEQKEALLHALVKSHDNLLKTLKTEEEWLSGGVKARLKRNEGRKARVFKMREDAKKNPSAIKKITA